MAKSNSTRSKNPVGDISNIDLKRDGLDYDSIGLQLEHARARLDLLLGHLVEHDSFDGIKNILLFAPYKSWNRTSRKSKGG